MQTTMEVEAMDRRARRHRVIGKVRSRRSRAIYGQMAREGTRFSDGRSHRSVLHNQANKHHVFESLGIDNPHLNMAGWSSAAIQAIRLAVADATYECCVLKCESKIDQTQKLDIPKRYFPIRHAHHNGKASRVDDRSTDVLHERRAAVQCTRAAGSLRSATFSHARNRTSRKPSVPSRTGGLRPSQHCTCSALSWPCPVRSSAERLWFASPGVDSQQTSCWELFVRRQLVTRISYTACCGHAKRPVRARDGPRAIRECEHLCCLPTVSLVSY